MKYNLRKSIKSLPGIYGIKNLVTKQIYIGSAEKVRVRLQAHFALLLKNKHNNPELQKDFLKYGVDAFFPIVFKYNPKQKIAAETKLIRLLLKSNIKVYNYIIPSSNKRLKVGSKNTIKYIIKNIKLNRLYKNITDLKEFYAHNKAYGCPSSTKLYKMLKNNKTYKNWVISIDQDNPEELIRRRQNKLGTSESYNQVYYSRIIQWKITNIKTQQEVIVDNLMSWCNENNVHYNRFQRYKDCDRTFKGTWQLEKIKV